MYHLEELQNRFKDLTIHALGDWGANIYLPSCVATVYWSKNKKYNINTSTVWHKYGDLSEFIEVVERLINPPKKDDVIVKEAVKNDIGTKACIDHLKRKVALMQAGNGNNNTIMMLKQLVEEIKQYL